MPRDLIVVIDQMIKEIPSSEQTFLEIMKDRRSSVAYCAPEMIGFWWHELAKTLNDEFGDDEAVLVDWQKRVINVWMDSEFFEVSK